MVAPRKYEPTGVDVSGDRFTVEQTGTDGNFRPEYEARDGTGTPLFRTTYQMYEERDAFPFVDADGEELFTVRAEGTWDVAGDYVLTDSQTGEDLVVLDNDLSLLRDTWRVRDADDGTLLAAVESRGALYTLARTLLPAGQYIGHEYEVRDTDGDVTGAIEAGFGVFDEYEVTFQDAGALPRTPLVAGAIVVDAIQEN
jgi:uncharacterized protein YxjI